VLLGLAIVGTEETHTMENENPWYIETAELAEMLFPEAGVLFCEIFRKVAKTSRGRLHREMGRAR
jgi:hypothetical protein